MENVNFKFGDLVQLPLNETGKIIKINNYLLGFNYIVKIKKAVFNKTNQHVAYKKEQLKLL